MLMHSNPVHNIDYRIAYPSCGRGKYALAPLNRAGRDDGDNASGS
jgi:hypothetical protein